MGRDREQSLGAGLRERSVAAADCRGRDCCAGAGWGGGRGSWLSEVEARGTDRGPRTRGAGAQAPGGPWKTWLPSCGGG